MIKLNDKILELDRFPDGTLHINPEIYNDCDETIITWHYKSDEEIPAIMFLCFHLRSIGIANVHLVMPYIPNARQDRVKSKQDVFTLKYFAEFINALGFNSVTVLDPHSYVSEALFNRLIIESPKKYIEKVLTSLCDKENRDALMVFYPDEGAMKRYSGMLSYPYAFGIKRRDWATGKIEGLDVAGETERIDGRNILIIDDISSRGGTFYHSAKKLKELGANHIYLYVTHCEPTILDGEVFTSGLIDKVFTTNTIFDENAQGLASLRRVSDKMEVMEYEKD